MKKNFLKKLITASYINNELDAETVEKIAPLLTRKELKDYIRGLKAKEKASRVIITGAADMSRQRYKFAEVFPDKKLIFTTNKELLLGVEIIDNDMVYEMNIKNTLARLGAYLNE